MVRCPRAPRAVVASGARSCPLCGRALSGPWSAAQHVVARLRRYAQTIAVQFHEQAYGVVESHVPTGVDADTTEELVR